MSLILRYFAEFGRFWSCNQTVDCARFINVLYKFIFNADACPVIVGLYLFVYFLLNLSLIFLQS